MSRLRRILHATDFSPASRSGFARAMSITGAALSFAPRNPELLAQLAREQLLADRVEGHPGDLVYPDLVIVGMAVVARRLCAAKESVI
jgi:hypothetical protein